MTVERLEDEESKAMLPPHDRRAEAVVIGSVFRDLNCMAKLGEFPAADFYDQRHKAIWKAMLDLWENGKPPNEFMVATRLADGDEEKAKKIMAELIDIGSNTPSAAYVEHYAKLVSDSATQRRLATFSARASELAWRPGANVEELIVEIQGLFEAAKPRRSRRDLYSPEQMAEEFWADMERRMNGERVAITTGLADLDTMTLGLEAGRLYLLLGVTGSGKSELSTQIAIHAGKRHGAVLNASLEMTHIEIAQRFVRITHGMDRNNLATGRLNDAEQVTLANAMGEMAKSNFWVASPSGHYTTADLLRDALEAQAAHGKLALVIADYVQLFKDEAGHNSSREENISAVANGLKAVARQLHCPVLAPVQSNREYAARSSKKPQLTDMRGSGDLENAADVVFGMYRDEKHDPNTKDRGILEVLILKNRSGTGQTEGSRKFMWHGDKYVDRAVRGDLPWAN